MNEKRVRILKKGAMGIGPVVYWMSRDQRVNDNWALLFAQDLAISQKLPLTVIFCLVPSFLEATIRQYGFMIKGLQKLEKNLAKKRIPFFLLRGLPEKEIPKFVKRYKVSSIVTDFNPLHIKKNWDAKVAKNTNIPFYQVDAHNIVPCWLSSPKHEYSARTFRSKIHKALPEFLEDYVELKKHPISWKESFPSIDWENIIKNLDIDFSVPEVQWIKSGEDEAYLVMHDFLENKLFFYHKDRNNPTKDGQSNLSPYIHFGQISAQRIAIEVLKTDTDEQSKKAFLEELIVRKELSDNYCFYNINYDNFNGLPEWSKKTLNKHRYDRRKYIYTLEQFENAKTHDDLWNAAQMEMVKKGKMHGYMRMYWAKKILEWSESPEQAFKIAIYLNDKYELDGRDPNGYTGIAWSLGGLHDRAWNERPIFGKVRYMSYNGCKSKFDVNKYIEYVQSI